MKWYSALESACRDWPKSTSNHYFLKKKFFFEKFPKYPFLKFFLSHVTFCFAYNFSKEHASSKRLRALDSACRDWQYKILIPILYMCRRGGGARRPFLVLTSWFVQIRRENIPLCGDVTREIEKIFTMDPNGPGPLPPPCYTYIKVSRRILIDLELLFPTSHHSTLYLQRWRRKSTWGQLS